MLPKPHEPPPEAIWSYRPRCGVTIPEMIMITWQGRLQAVIQILLWLMVLATALWGSHRLTHMALVHIARAPIPLPVEDPSPGKLALAGMTFILFVPVSIYGILKEAQYLRPRPRIIGWT
jgi:hypothetical protein